MKYILIFYHINSYDTKLNPHFLGYCGQGVLRLNDRLLTVEKFLYVTRLYKRLLSAVCVTFSV